MKGVVKRNTSPTTACPVKNSWQPAPFPLSRTQKPARCGLLQCCSSKRRIVPSELKSETSIVADHSSIRASRATAFPGRARGDRVTAGPWAVAAGHRLRGSSPSTLTVPGTIPAANEGSIAAPVNSSGYGYVVVFSFLGSNSFPFFQTTNATAEILRASVMRVMSADRPRCVNRSTYGL